ncbi:MAG: ABC transporter permease [Treponema sp.]|nr:MAG: ABC transporter permease [Treponema sp.]
MKKMFFITYAARCLGVGKKGEASNARKSLIGACIGIGISIVPLIVVLVLSNGMINGITTRMVELGSGHIRLLQRKVLASENDGRHEKALKNNLLNKYKDNPYFKNAWVERQGTGLLIGKTGRSGGQIRAIEKKFFTENTGASKLIQVLEGKLEFENNKTLFLGKKLAANLHLNVGDTCRILTFKTGKKGTPIPKMSVFKVGAIVSSGYQDLDALWIFIPLEKGLQIFKGSNSLTSILVTVDDVFNDSLFEPFVYSLKNNYSNKFRIYTWKDLNQSQFMSFKTTKNILLFVMFLIILVASTNISSALVMLVLERTREIAILKATGASSSNITLAFLTAGVITSLGGILVGLPLGILLALNINSLFKITEKTINYLKYLIHTASGKTSELLYVHILDPEYYLEHIPIKITLPEIFLIATGILILSILVSIIPSIRAGNEKPIDIMRKL